MGEALRSRCKWNSPLFSVLKSYPLSFWGEGLEVDEVSKEPLGRRTRITALVWAPCPCQARTERRERGECHLRSPAQGGRTVWKLLMNGMLDFICCVSSRACCSSHLAPLWLMGSRCLLSGESALRNTEPATQTPFPFCSSPEINRGGKLHPSNDPARGLNCNRLKPILCFKDLCNFKRKKNIYIYIYIYIKLKAKFSQLDSFRNFSFHVKSYYCRCQSISLSLTLHVSPCCPLESLDLFSALFFTVAF